MSKLVLLALTLAGLFSIQAQADFLGNINAGAYDSYSYRSENAAARARFEILKRGSVIGLKDRTRTITYRLDLNDKKEQFLPQKYIDDVLHDERRGNIGKLINAVSLSNVRVYGDAMDLTMNIYLKAGDVFGGFEGVLQLEARVGAGKCEIFSNDGTYLPSTCLAIEYGRSIRLTDVKTGLPQGQNLLLVSVLEFAVKMATPPGPILDRLFEMK